MSTLYQQILELNTQICKCPKCKGFVGVLCKSCTEIEKQLIILEQERKAKTAPTQ